MELPDPLTGAQANELSRYLLGREWHAYYIPRNPIPCMVLRGDLTPDAV